MGGPAVPLCRASGDAHATSVRQVASCLSRSGVKVQLDFEIDALSAMYPSGLSGPSGLFHVTPHPSLWGSRHDINCAVPVIGFIKGFD